MASYLEPTFPSESQVSLGSGGTGGHRVVSGYQRQWWYLQFIKGWSCMVKYVDIPIDTMATCRHCCLGENLGENVYIMFSFMLSCIAFDQL